VREVLRQARELGARISLDLNYRSQLWTPEQARAVTAGAFAVAHRGDWEGLPGRDELSLLDAGPQQAHR
jgi:sugar/nucleoside kinase (ribokinase family)